LEIIMKNRDLPNLLRIKPIIILVFFSFFPGLFLALPSAQAAPVGKVTLVVGSVTVLKARNKVATPVKKGDPVDLGDLYSTKGESGAEILFHNNNILRIADKTRIEIAEYTVTERRTSNIIKLPEGKVNITTGADFTRKVSLAPGDHKFEVHTPVAVAGIRGSSANIAHLYQQVRQVGQALQRGDLSAAEQGITGILVTAGQGYLINHQFPNRIQNLLANTVSFTASNIPPTTLERVMQHAVTNAMRSVGVQQQAAVIEAAYRIGIPWADVIQGAHEGGASGSTIALAVVQSAGHNQVSSLIAGIVQADLQQTEDIVSAAIRANPALAADIIAGALAANPTQLDAITRAALQAGASPQSIQQGITESKIPQSGTQPPGQGGGQGLGGGTTGQGGGGGVNVQSQSR
jgi:hypothetical protein